MFVGSLDEGATISLKDSQSRERLRLIVDSAGNARLEFLDDKREAVYSLTPENCYKHEADRDYLRKISGCPENLSKFQFACFF